jgi:hypothetical protein
LDGQLDIVERAVSFRNVALTFSLRKYWTII